MNKEKLENTENSKVELFFKYAVSDKAVFVVFIISLLLAWAVGVPTSSTGVAAFFIFAGAFVMTFLYWAIMGLASMLFIYRKSLLTIFLLVTISLFIISLLR